MSRLIHFALAGFLGALASAYGQPTPRTTVENAALFFPAVDLTTNGLPGLTNASGKLQVTRVTATSQQGGVVSLVTTQAWVRRYDGPGNYWDSPFLLALDAMGNCAVSGISFGGSSGYDIATVFYANDGTALWTNRYDGPAHKDEGATSLAIDNAGNIYAGGSSSVSMSIHDAVIIKYGANGLPLWTNRFNYFGTNYHGLQKLAVDESGNVYALIATVYADVGYLTLKYDMYGHAVWTNRYNPRADGSEFPASLSLDGAGNVFVHAPPIQN